MYITIGEIINELMYYTNKIEINMFYDKIPFIRTTLSNGNGFTKCYMYIIQNSEHSYSVCDDVDEHFCRIIPSENPNKPFMRENIKISYNYSNAISMYFSEVYNINKNEFIDYLYDRMMLYDVIDFNQDRYNIKLLNLFNNTKIISTFEKSFSHNYVKNGSIRDLINIVNKQNIPFDLYYLKDKDLFVIEEVLSSLGINLVINQNKIAHITFNKKKVREYSYDNN